MCARFERLFDSEELEKRYRAAADRYSFGRREQVYPTDETPIVRMEDGAVHIHGMKWGFNPEYLKKPVINARCETLAEKPMFRKALVSKRCIVPASAFYEWEAVASGKVRRKIGSPSEKIISLAALYESFKQPDGVLQERFVIVTTDASEYVSSIHERMPLILAKEQEHDWLSPVSRLDDIFRLLSPYKGKLYVE